MQIISECARILKDGGTLFLQVGSTRDEPTITTAGLNLQRRGGSIPVSAKPGEF
jgi:hypothetical protein